MYGAAGFVITGTVLKNWLNFIQLRIGGCNVIARNEAIQYTEAWIAALRSQ
jgi:hypothetical protein